MTRKPVPMRLLSLYYPLETGPLSEDEYYARFSEPLPVFWRKSSRLIEHFAGRVAGLIRSRHRPQRPRPRPTENCSRPAIR